MLVEKKVVCFAGRIAIVILAASVAWAQQISSLERDRAKGCCRS